MVDISLEEFEDFYKSKLNNEFYKEKKIAGKLINDIKENLIEIKICMDHFLEAEENLDQKALRSLNFFSDRIKKEIDEIDIPEEEINHENLTSLLNSIKKLFININDIAKKSLPKFQKEVQSEIKELNYITRKLNRKQAVLDGFLRKKYKEIKNAEELLGKLPKFYNLRENIENTKQNLDNFEKEHEELQKNLEGFNRNLIKLEKNDLFQDLKNYRDSLFKLKIKINNELGFKKALKKLKVEIERDNIHLQNLDENYIREFIKDPIHILSREGKDLTKFRGLLVQLRHILEDGKLNLKTDKKQKTIEQINKIFDDKRIYEELDELKNLRSKIDDIKREIEKNGLDEKLDSLKNEISVYTQRLEHIENDIERKNKDYLRYLSALKKEREEFQKLIENVIKEEFKLNITITF